MIMNYRNSAYTAAVALTLAVPVVMHWEGVSTKPYRDWLAYGIPTVCYGETEGVKMTDTYTVQECADQLKAKLPRYENEVLACVHVPVKPEMLAAFISFAYNVGSGAFCNGSVSAKLNAGDYAGACDALLLYNKAGGKFVVGLANRRQAEAELCRKGIR